MNYYLYLKLLVLLQNN